LRFGLTFAALMTVFYGLSLLPLFDRALLEYLRVNAWLSNVILNTLGQNTEVVGLTIRAEHFSIAIRRGCDAIEPAWLFASAVLAFPMPWRQRLFGILAGVPLLCLLNLVRIVSLYFIGAYAPSLFYTMHLEVWPAIFILAAGTLWFFWMRWARAEAAVEG